MFCSTCFTAESRYSNGCALQPRWFGKFCSSIPFLEMFYLLGSQKCIFQLSYMRKVFNCLFLPFCLRQKMTENTYCMFVDWQYLCKIFRQRKGTRLVLVLLCHEKIVCLVQCTVYLDYKTIIMVIRNIETISTSEMK